MKLLCSLDPPGPIAVRTPGAPGTASPMAPTAKTEKIRCLT